MPDERRQFRVLYRDFLSRIVDLELLSNGGDMRALLGQFAALLGALGFVFAVLFVPRYATSTLPHATLMKLVWVDEEFLIGTTMAIAGLFAVLAWNVVQPDRREALVLGLLPVRIRTIALAKFAAVATALGIAVVALNLFTGLAYPLIVAPPEAGALGALRCLGAYWFVLMLSGALVWGGLLALQGLLALVLSYRVFLRLSGWMQLAAFFATVGMYFLKPPFRNHAAGSWLPSYWFFALFQKLTGAAEPAFASLADRAIWSLAIVIATATGAFALCYARNMRRIIEQPEIAPADRSRPSAQLAAFCAARFLPRAIDRAILLFTARGMARSRHHRLMLAAYGGVGLAISMAYARDLLYSTGSFFDPLGIPTGSRWNVPNVPILAATLVLLFFAVVGARAVFTLPIALPANWIFRLTAVHSPAAYFAAVRKTLTSVAVAPALLIAATLLFAIWPAAGAIMHLAILALTALLLVELSLYRFRKLPFACSYLPGKANINVKLGIYLVVLLTVGDQLTHLELWAIHRTARLAVLFAILAAAALWARRRTVRFAASPDNEIQFEDLPADQLEVIDLHRDGGFSGGQRYIDQPAPPEPVSVRAAAEQWMRDLASGARVLTRSPGFSAAAVALIALGIGGNTAIFSMIHGVLTRPAPGIHAKGLVSFGITVDGRLAEGGPEHSFPDYVEYATQSKTVASLAAFGGTPGMILTLADGTWQLRGGPVTSNYFATLGVGMARGRGFTSEEARGAGEMAAVIAYHVWQNQFHGAEDILGKHVVLNGHPVTIVGVTERGFHGAQFVPNLEIAVPLVSYFRNWRGGAELIERSIRSLGVLGRLKPGVSLAEAQAEFTTISQRIQAEHPEIAERRMVVLAPYSATAFTMWQGAQAALFMRILLAVGFVALLVVCANVANLTLARAAARQRELAVRRSLGASQFRIMRILLAESLAISFAAAAAAVGFAFWAARAIVNLTPALASGARIEPDLAPDWHAILYAVLLAVLSSLAFTIAPSVRAWRQQILPWLKSGENSVAPGQSLLSNTLVIAQLALSVVLLASAGIASRSVLLLGSLDMHFAKDHLLLATVDTRGAPPSGAENVALLERLRARLRTLPGAISVSYASAVPGSTFGQWTERVAAEGDTRHTVSNGMFAGPEYLDTLKIAPIAGRGISRADISGSIPAAVINRNLADTLWPRQSPVGRLLTIFGKPVTVIGVVPNAAYSSLQPDSHSNFALVAESPLASPPGAATFHLRYAGDPATLATALRLAVREQDPRVPVIAVRTMQSELEADNAPAILVSGLLALFSAVCLAIAAIGLYAVVAFQTLRRTREFGIRAALGATSRQVQAAVLRQGFVLAITGVAIGLAAAAAVGRAFGSLLFGISATDPTTYFGVIALLALVSLLACYIPARRASRIDPVRALRQD
jgi:predicted permease